MGGAEATLLQHLADAVVDDVGGDGYVLGQHLEVFDLLQQLTGVAGQAERGPRHVPQPQVQSALHRRVATVQHRELHRS